MDAPDIEWPREIWAAERGEFDPTGYYVLSEVATVARFEGDKERDREFHHYIDADVHESQGRYFKAMLETLRVELRALVAETAEAVSIASAIAAERDAYRATLLDIAAVKHPDQQRTPHQEMARECVQKWETGK